MHARALRRSRVYRRPVEMIFWRYALGRGTYPATVQLRIPHAGNVDIQIRSHFDLLTVQEIFLWQCYPCDGDEAVILDLGANIGASMIYFLAGAPRARVVGVEPLDGNFAQARLNLDRYGDRAKLINAAVMNYDGSVELGVEDTGRYSGIGLSSERTEIVRCIDVNALIDETVQSYGRIDLMKVDVEGAEGPILRGVTEAGYAAIGRIAVEGEDIPYSRLEDVGFKHRKHASGVHWFGRKQT